MKNIIDQLIQNIQISINEQSKDYEIKEYNDAVLFVIHKNKEKVIKYIEKLILEK